MVGRAVLLSLLLLAPLVQAAPSPDWPQRMVGAVGTGRDGSGLVVAVLDSGIDRTHPDVAGKFWQNPDEAVNGLDDDGNGYVDDVDGWDFCHGAPPRQRPGFGHGTFVAGVLAGEGRDGGVRGVAPGVRLMDLQVYCDNNSYPGNEPLVGRDSLRAGLAYAIAEGADIIHMSLQLWDDQPDEAVPALLATLLPRPEEFKAAHDAGIVVVAAAGNLGSLGPESPGSNPFVITVGATTGCGFRHGFSNWGDQVELWAPGRAYGPTLGGGHEWSYGTSFAAPLVSGAVALLLEDDPKLSPDAVLDRLLAAAAPSEDGPVLDLHPIFGAESPGGRARLDLLGPTAVGGPSYLQYALSGDEPTLLEVGNEEYGRYCFNLADESEELRYYVAPASDEPIRINARALGATWSGPWLNTTFRFQPDGPQADERPLLVAARAPDGPMGAPALLVPVLAVALLLAAARRR